jgi:hypothetical protein
VYKENILKDSIFDIVRHTASLGFFDLAKITGTDQTTEVWTCDEKKTVVLDASLNNPEAGLIGEVGLGNLAFLNGLSGLYNKEGAEVEVLKTTKNGAEVPEYVQFTDKDGNSDKYRLMSKEIIDEQLQQSKFKGVKWDVEFEPLKAKVSEMSAKAGIYSNIEPTFTVKTENGNLVFVFGSDTGGSHFGKMIFATNVAGTIKEGYAWPIDKFLSIVKLGMAGECRVHFSQVACMITINSGIGTYNYILPGHTR